VPRSTTNNIGTPISELDTLIVWDFSPSLEMTAYSHDLTHAAHLLQRFHQPRSIIN